MANPSLLFAIFFSALLVQGGLSITVTLKNNCPNTVWPAAQDNDKSPAFPNTGFELAATASVSVDPPAQWAGRIWARTGCSTDASGKFSCQTGECGSGQVACNGKGGVPPITLAEFKLQDKDGKDTYDVSCVDGFNLPLSIAPQGGSGCQTTTCSANINARCPAELQVTASGQGVVGCKSACNAFNTDEYCCRGAYNSPETCKPSSYSQIFKNLCPQAYSYAYDDPSSTFTCVGVNYLITFCPS